jgi:hypothetical protein
MRSRVFWTTEPCAGVAELEQAFLSQLPQRAEHGVRVDPEHGREVLCRRESLTRLRLALGDRSTDLRRDLLVEVGRFGSIDLDRNHDASDNSTKDRCSDECNNPAS